MTRCALLYIACLAGCGVELPELRYVDEITCSCANYATHPRAPLKARCERYVWATGATDCVAEVERACLESTGYDCVCSCP